MQAKPQLKSPQLSSKDDQRTNKQNCTQFSASPSNILNYTNSVRLDPHSIYIQVFSILVLFTHLSHFMCRFKCACCNASKEEKKKKKKAHKILNQNQFSVVHSRQRLLFCFLSFVRSFSIRARFFSPFLLFVAISMDYGYV